jgi:signal peptidase I
MDRYAQRYPADDDAAWEATQRGYEGGGFSGAPPRRTGFGGWDNQGGLPPPPPPRPAPRTAAPRRRAHLAREIIETLVLTLVIFLAVHFSVQTFRVDGESMMPGLNTDEYVLVNKLAYLFHGPSRGDVIVFQYPVDPRQDFIKRVIGLPGDTIKITPTQVYVNGVLLREPYISQAENPTVESITLKPNQYFVMGDNRPKSSDSRSWGPVPSNYIIGKATVVFWPLGNWEIIPTYSSVYASIPPPQT